MAFRVLAPQPGIEPVPSARKAQSPNHWTIRYFPGIIFLMLNNIPLYGYTTFCWSIHPLKDTWTTTFFPVVNSAVVNMGVQVSLQVHAFSSFGNIFRSRIAGSCGNSLNFLRNYQTVFCHCCTIKYINMTLTVLQKSIFFFQKSIFDVCLVVICQMTMWKFKVEHLSNFQWSQIIFAVTDNAVMVLLRVYRVLYQLLKISVKLLNTDLLGLNIFQGFGHILHDYSPEKFSMFILPSVVADLAAFYCTLAFLVFFCKKKKYVCVCVCVCVCVFDN